MKKILPFLLFALFLPSDHSILSSESFSPQKVQVEMKHEVKVILKLIRVFVTDRDGNPVQDLKKSDFLLFDNGELKEITDFERHIPPEQKEASEGKEKASLVDSLPEAGRKFFILLDSLKNDEVATIKSKRAALHFIETQLVPGDEVGILTFTPLRGLNIHTYLTSDHQKIRKAVKDAKELPPGDGFVADEIVEEQERMEKEHELGEESLTTRQFTHRLDLNIPGMKMFARSSRDAYRDITEMAKTFRFIPGDKNLLFFSGGGLSSREYNKMGQEFGSASTPVFVINTMINRSPPDKRPSKDPLKALAEVSGGKYFEDVDQFQAISEKIQEATNFYYVLGYYVDEKWDGSYHEIKVKVKRKECLVHAQAGYFNPKPFAALSEFDKRLHLVDLALSETPHFQNPLSFDLVALPFAGWKELNTVLLSEIRLDELKDVVSGETEIVNLVFDGEKNIVDSSQGKIDFSGILKNKVYYYSTLSLLPGEYECRVVIRNLTTGHGAVAASSVKIPGPMDSRIRLYPPLLLVPDNDAHYVKDTKAEKGEDANGPSLNDVYPFISSAYSPLVQKLDKHVSKLYAVLRTTFRGREEPDVEVSVSLLEQLNGQRMRLEFSILDARNYENTDILLLEIRLPELKVGDYRIEITGEDTSTKSRTIAVYDFRYTFSGPAISSIDANRLDTILGKSAAYCESLSKASMDFVCREKIEEVINPTPTGSIKYEIYLRMSERPV